MGVVTEVLSDLYKFAFVYWFGFKKSSTPTVAQSTDTEVDSDLGKTIQAIIKDDTKIKLLEKSPEPTLIEPVATPSLDRIGYAINAKTYLYALPTRTFDGVIERLPYGASFLILNNQGKWLQVLYGETKGWILIDQVSESSVSLNPKFIIGQVYESDHKDTIKLRTWIEDLFHAADLDLPLQNVEYVTFRLLKKNHQINWPNERPRIAGTWQSLLKGEPGVHLGINPKTAAVMEYIKADNTGHVAYVESVFPDESIAISEVGHPTEGIYNERVLAKEDWKELRPIFIEAN